MRLPALAVTLATAAAACAAAVAAMPDGGAKATVSLNVYAVLSPAVVEHARAVSADLGQAGLAAFPAAGHRVHCTLYLTEYPASRAADVVGKVRLASRQRKRFPVATAGLLGTRSHWLFVNLERTPALQRLSDDVVEMLAPLRFPSPAVPGWLAAYPDKRNSFDKYGSPNVGPHFEPHVTLLASADAAALGPWMKDRSGRFQAPVRGEVVGLGVAVADALGQVREPLLEAPLSAP